MSTESKPGTLFKISQKQERKIVGLMSGTSLDGLDIALCTFTNSGSSTKVNLNHFLTAPYDTSVKLRIKNVFSQKSIQLEELCDLNAWLGTLHGNMVLECLRAWNYETSQIDLIASHGQTIYHAPKSGKTNNSECPINSTLQIGDGDHIAVKTGIITVSDFRQKHIAAGGEGAPLALYGDYFIFSKQGEDRIMLNIGGVSNMTILYGDLDASKAFATDLGPGNTLVDAATQKFFQKDFDEHGKIASLGKINKTLLEALKNQDFFAQAFPKTTGPELFNLELVEVAQMSTQTLDIPFEDLIATLTRFSSEIIAEGIKNIENAQNFKIYCSGGGIHNPVLMNHIRQILIGMEINPTNVLGLNGDAKEAVLFAALANETICGARTDFGSRKAVPNVSMGKISFPD